MRLKTKFPYLIFFLFTTILLFISCNNKNNTESKNISKDSIIEKELFKKIVLEINLAEAKYNLHQNKAELPFNKNDVAFFILSKYKLDTTTFNNSFRYYSNDYKEISDIYESIDKSLDTISITRKK